MAISFDLANASLFSIIRRSNAPCAGGLRKRKDHRGVDLISDVLPFGRVWYGEPNAVSNAIGYAEHRSRSHDTVIRVHDESGQCA
jgi:hypothetical protein